MKSRKTKSKAAQNPHPIQDNCTENSFDEYYAQQWQERWPRLRSALLQAFRYVARLNSFSCEKELFISTHQQKNVQRHIFAQGPRGSIECLIPEKSHFFLSLKAKTALLPAYFMDLASIFPVLALDIQAHDTVLDLCAAPGGKALAMLELIESAHNLYLNEVSASRTTRLRKVLTEYVPQDIISQITLSQKDGRTYFKTHPQTFNKILLDAPCSGERHLLHAPEELKLWTEKRSPQLAYRQYNLLRSAWHNLATGGTLVYSTCSISQLENEAIIAKFLKKTHDASLVQNSYPLGSSNKYGYYILPDEVSEGFAGGWGPIFFATLKKS